MLNLNVIVWSIWITVVLNLVYSLMVFFMFAPECYAQRISLGWNSFFTLFNRFTSYIVWFWPIIYLFWPTKRHINQEKRINKMQEYTTANNRVSINRYQAQTESNESSSSSDDDRDYDFASMGTSDVFHLSSNSKLK